MEKLNLNKRFGITVKTWRNRAGLSQEDLGELAGLHRTYISDVERGVRNVSLTSVDKLASALAIPETALFGEDCPRAEVSEHPKTGIPESPGAFR